MQERGSHLEDERKDGGKFVKPAKTGAAFWKYQGVYENPFGVDMYIVERVPSATVTVG